MIIGKKYNPPDCPKYIFFRGESLDDVLRQRILSEKGKSITAGPYNYISARIIPVLSMPTAKIRQIAKENPKEVIAAPLEESINL